MKGIQEALTNQRLPESVESLLSELQDGVAKYVFQEGGLWDFKRDWPFSYSDEYFGAIARLICAFANSYGGIIVFGVHDEDRTPGHNKVAPNLDRLEQALASVLSSKPVLQLKRHQSKTPNAVELLLVCPRDPNVLPIRFKKGVGKIKEGTIWVRQGHEVVAAEPKHVGLLYCRSKNFSEEDEDQSLQGGLPPSPATIKRFVGRLNTIDRIFYWLKSSDEPRTFLYGKGGSGKTTIAYEVAKVLKFEGSQVNIYGGDRLDNVIFLSAKQKVLDVIGGSVRDFVGLDFSNERELYEGILTLSGWSSNPLDQPSVDELKKEIRDLFDLTSNFIVIDDIDTLTTKGFEAGFDFLYGILWRAKRRSKILYTIRNAPTHSLANSIEVPGLEGGDYEEFVRVCAEQFKVQPPEPIFVNTKLAQISERRPLVVESIITLRRTAGDYDRAIRLFEEESGDDVRNYVFQREWNSLPADNYGRYVLAVIALNGEALAFADIVTLTRYDDARVRGALSDIREMFLQLNEIGSETTYQVGALTRAFVYEQSKKLDIYPALKERVEKYKRNFYPENPILSRLRDGIESLVGRGRRFNDIEALARALQAVTDRTLAPKITEDPRFLALQAYVYVCQRPPNLEDARRLFGHVFSMKYEPDIEYLKEWFYAERDSGHGLTECVKIADLVWMGKKYSDEEKVPFLARKGTALYNRGKNDLFFSSESGFRDIRDSLVCHLICFKLAVEANFVKMDKSEEYARNTAFYLFSFASLHGRYGDFFDALIYLCDLRDVVLDPIEDGVIKALEPLHKERGGRAELTKIKGRLEYARKEVERKSQWFDQQVKRRVVQAMVDAGDAVDASIGSRRAT